MSFDIKSEIGIYITIKDIVNIINDYARYLFVGITTEEEKKMVHLLNVETTEIISSWKIETLDKHPNYCLFPKYNKIIRMHDNISVAKIYPANDFVNLHLKPDNCFAWSDKALYFQVRNSKLEIKRKIHAIHRDYCRYVDVTDPKNPKYAGSKACMYHSEKYNLVSTNSNSLDVVVKWYEEFTPTNILRYNVENDKVNVFTTTKYVESVSEYQGIYVSKSDRTVIIKEDKKCRVFIDGVEKHEIVLAAISSLTDNYINSYTLPYDPMYSHCLYKVDGTPLFKYYGVPIINGLFDNIIALYKIVDNKSQVVLYNTEDPKVLKSIVFDTECGSPVFINSFVIHIKIIVHRESIYISDNNSSSKRVLIINGKRTDILDTEHYWYIDLL